MKNPKMLLILLLGFMVLGPVSWATERTGAQVVVSLKSGGEARGELLAVKKDYLVIAALSSGDDSDLSLRVADVREVRIVRRSKAGMSALIGFGVGVGGGALLGVASGDDEGSLFSFTAGQKAAMYAAFFGALGAAVGAIAGGASGTDTSFLFDRQPARDQQEQLRRLSRSAKIQGIQ